MKNPRHLEACTKVAKPIKAVRLRAELTGSQPTPAWSKRRRKKTSKNEPRGPWREELSRFFGIDLTAIPSVSVLTGITLMTDWALIWELARLHTTLVPGSVCVRLIQQAQPT